MCVCISETFVPHMTNRADGSKRVNCGEFLLFFCAGRLFFGREASVSSSPSSDSSFSSTAAFFLLRVFTHRERRKEKKNWNRNGQISRLRQAYKVRNIKESLLRNDYTRQANVITAL